MATLSASFVKGRSFFSNLINGLKAVMMRTDSFKSLDIIYLDTNACFEMHGCLKKHESEILQGLQVNWAKVKDYLGT